jgi:hypothetical protein
MEVVGSALKHFGDENDASSTSTTSSNEKDASSTSTTSSTCFASVRAASAEIAAKLSDDEGLAELSRLFQTCGNRPMSTANTSRLDLQTFVSNVVGSWQGLVQYNRPAPQTMSVAHMCGALNARVDAGASPLEAFAVTTVEIASAPLAARNITGYCTEISDSDSIEQLKNVTFDGLHSMRQWVFMTCNEFGYFQVAGKNTELDPFASLSNLLDLDMFKSMCDRAYGWQGASPATQWSNSKYGLPGDISAENVTFPSGSLDPWHVLGMTNTSNPIGSDFEMPCDCKISELQELPVFIPFTSHCQDMGRCPVGMDGEQNCSVPHIAWAHEIIHARIDGYLGKSGGGGGISPAPSPGTSQVTSNHAGVIIATGFAAFAAGVSLALMVPKIIQCARRRRRGADRTVWGGVQNGESHYHGFGVGAGTDI